MLIFKALKIEIIEKQIQIVYLNRPDVLNAINTQLAKDLRSYFLNFRKKESEVRCVIITGSGDKAFCAGADLKERKSMTDKKWYAQHHFFEEAGYALTSCPIPVIAAVNGVAFGGGCEIAMACDFIFASFSATFAQPEVKLGVIPGLGGTQRLPRLIGLNRAKELLYTGRRFSAEEAFKWGMLNGVLAPHELLPHTLKVAKEIVENGSLAVKQAKKAIDRGYAIPITKALNIEIEAYNKVVTSQDRKEGILAFNEKRKPKFKGR